MLALFISQEWAEREELLLSEIFLQEQQTKHLLL